MPDYSVTDITCKRIHSSWTEAAFGSGFLRRDLNQTTGGIDFVQFHPEHIIGSFSNPVNRRNMTRQSWSEFGRRKSGSQAILRTRDIDLIDYPTSRI